MYPNNSSASSKDRYRTESTRSPSNKEYLKVRNGLNFLGSPSIELNLPPKRDSTSHHISFSSDQIQQIQDLYKNLRRDLLNKLDHHHNELLLLLQNVTITSFNPFFKSPKNTHPLNKTSYAQKYLSITCVYQPIDSCESLIDFEENEDSKKNIDAKNKIIMYPFGYYKLKDTLSSHQIDFTVRPLSTTSSDSSTKIQGVLEQSEDGLWVIVFNPKVFEEFTKELKLEFEGVLI